MIELKKQSAAVSVEAEQKKIDFKKPTTKGEDGKDGKDGADGGYYIPYINEYCELYFTPTKPDMPKVNGRNIRGNKGEKGDSGADGKDGFSPNVYLGNLENGTRVYIVTKDGTKSFDVLNGKDGEAKVTVKSKYYTNDWATSLIMPNIISGSGEIAFITMEDMPDNIYIVDVSVHYNGVEYRLHDLVYYGEVSASTVVEIPRKPVYSKDNNWYIVARTHEDYESNKISDAAVFWDTNLEGFTVYYIECDEVEVIEE